MLRGIYTSASGMIVQMDKEDVLSNNLANVDTTGFKKDQTIIKEFPGFEIFTLSNKGYTCPPYKQK